MIAGLETYAAFLGGRGSGHGWDSENEVRTVASFVRRRPAVIFDVGANNGAWSLRLAKALDHRDNRFFLFECAPYCFPGIDERKDGIPNMTLIKAAVSESAGEATLHLPTRGSGLASLHERRDASVSQEAYEPVVVPTVTLDAVVSDHGLDRIDLLKMDIEGHELFALKGATRILSEGIVKTLTFEFGSANVNSRTFFRDFWELLSPFGYALHRILPGGGTVQVRRYSDELEYFRGATNYIASR